MNYEQDGLKFLYQSELLDDPLLINNLKMNIMMQSNYIKEVEMLSVTTTKQLLIYVELGFFGKLFFKRRIEPAVRDIVHQLLPFYEIRVIQDKSILELSKAKLEALITPLNS